MLKFLGQNNHADPMRERDETKEENFIMSKTTQGFKTIFLVKVLNQ